MNSSQIQASHFAYSKFPDLEVVMRLQAVKRWHMIETTRVQTLAEHTANVSLLGVAIALTTPGMFFVTSSVALTALVHDASESLIGDIPTHTKRLLGPLAKSLEAEVLPETFSSLVNPGERERDLIKLCDLIDGIRFIRIHGVDMTADHAQEGLEEQLLGLLDRVFLKWPLEVYQHVRERIVFYGYEESGIGSKGHRSKNSQTGVPPDLARDEGCGGGYARLLADSQERATRDLLARVEGRAGTEDADRNGGSPASATYVDQDTSRTGASVCPDPGWEPVLPDARFVITDVSEPRVTINAPPIFGTIRDE